VTPAELKAEGYPEMAERGLRQSVCRSGRLPDRLLVAQDHRGERSSGSPFATFPPMPRSFLMSLRDLAHHMPVEV
jgi:hypothetical protein